MLWATRPPPDPAPRLTDVQAALSGFTTIGLIVAAGALLAHLRILGDLHRALLSRLAFLVASPALLFSLVSSANLAHLFSHTLVVSILAIALAGLTYLALERLWFVTPGSERVIGWLTSCYTNAGNLGLPIAAAIMGDMTWMAPIMLIQVGFLQPLALALLDLAVARRDGTRLHPLTYVTLPFRNPITAAVLLGFAVNLAGVGVPAWLATPVGMVGAVAVPAMLLAFGVSLRLDPLPGKGEHAPRVWLAQAVKVVLHPVLAYVLGAYAFGLTGPELLAVTVMAALPAAQNIYVIASRYQVGELLARDAIFYSTLLSVPTITLVSALLR